MEQPKGYEVRPSDVYKVDIIAGKWVQGSNGSGSGGDGGSGIDDNKKSLVSLVDKALYGIIDAVKNWWCTLDDNMRRLGYKQLEADQSMRVRIRDGERTITSTYTNNTLGMSLSEEEGIRA